MEGLFPIARFKNSGTYLPVSKFRLIGLAGLAGCGKDTVALHLIKNYNFARIAFADPLKDAADIMLGYEAGTWKSLTPEYKNMLVPGKPYSWRQFWQKLGTEVGRNIDPDIWLTTAAKKIEAIRDLGFSGAVITDVRFENESKLIRELRGSIAHVYRIGLATMDHASEKGIEIKTHDFVLYNNGTIEELYRKVDKMMETLNS
jgi:hypothetical protein